MNNFDFKNTTHVVFGKDQIKQLSELIAPTEKVLVLYGGGSIKKNGVYDQVKSALKSHKWDEFSGIETNPQFKTLMKAVEKIKTEKYTYLLAVGGGSVIDGTKFIAAAVNFDGDPWDILEKAAGFTNALPLGAVLTLPATGSESNGTSVISRAETGQKLVFASRLVLPQFSILDPEACYSLPKQQIGNGVVDAFIHTTEQYLTYPVNAPIQDRFAESILKTLIEEGPIVYKDSKNYDAMANFMWSATMALNGLIGCGVPQDWATHMIGHELTAAFKLDHARTLAIVLPSLLRFKMDQKKDKLLQFAKNVWDITTGTDDEKIENAIQKTEAFFQQMGVPTRLTDYSIDASQVSKITTQLQNNKRLKLGEHMDITPDDAEQILKNAV